jgi:hypothetical protein
MLSYLAEAYLQYVGASTINYMFSKWLEVVFTISISFLRIRVNTIEVASFEGRQIFRNCTPQFFNIHHYRRQQQKHQEKS